MTDTRTYVSELTKEAFYTPGNFADLLDGHNPNFVGCTTSQRKGPLKSQMLGNCCLIGPLGVLYISVRYFQVD